MSSKGIKIAMIAGLASNRVIGNNNDLVWHIPKDMKWFRAKTQGKPVIMGRKTFESIGRLLPKRLNIIISRNENYTLPDFPDAKIENSLENAIDTARDYAQENSLDEIFIMGGQQIYTLGLPIADRLYLTHIDRSYDGDTFFPKFNEEEWNISYEEHVEAEDNTPAFTFNIYEKRSA